MRGEAPFRRDDLRQLGEFLERAEEVVAMREIAAGERHPNVIGLRHDMDNFIRSLNLQTGEVTGLSSVFAPGQTWNDVLGAGNITAVSPVYDLSDLHVAADGTVTVVAVPIPEPSTWALLLFGLLAMGSMARQRTRSRTR